MGIEPQKTFYTTDGSWIDWNPIAVEKTPKTPFGKAEKNAPKGGWPRLLLNEHLGGKRRFQKEEFEKCEPSKPKKWKKSQDLQLRGLATLEFLPFLGLWWAHFSSSWSLPLPSRYSSRSWLWSSTFSTFFARFPKGWGWVFIPQRWGSIWSENHRLYRRFFVVIFRFVVLFCRLTRKTDHSAFEIYLYSPLEVFVRWLAAKIHLVPPPNPSHSKTTIEFYLAGLYPRIFYWVFGKCQRYWALGISIFVWPERFLPDAACPASLPALTFKRLFVSCGCFL